MTAGCRWATERVDALVTRKGERLQHLLNGGTVLFPGAVAFIHQAAAAVPVAIASGALRHEIEEILQAARRGRALPDHRRVGGHGRKQAVSGAVPPAFEQLRAESGASLDPRRTVAIEDSRWGLESARGAGLRCVGVTNSYPAHALAGAELIAAGWAL